MALVVTKAFKCVCERINLVAYESNYGDSLNYNCPECGQYYKKAHRIEESQIIWESLVDAPCFYCKKPDADCICGY